MQVCEKCWRPGRGIDHAELGRTARQRREQRGISLRACAIQLGISEAFLSLLERGKRNWTRELYHKATR